MRRTWISYKTLRIKIGQKLQNVGFGDNFLDVTSKTRAIKEKPEKSDS